MAHTENCSDHTDRRMAQADMRIAHDGKHMAHFDNLMTCRCIIQPTPAFKIGHIYPCECIIGGFVAYDDDGFAWAADTVEFYRCFQVIRK